MNTRSLLIPLVVSAFGLPAIAHALDSITQPGPQELSYSANLPASPPRWAFFDFDSGIKTVELADGSIHEEPFEPGRTTQSLPGGKRSVRSSSYRKPSDAEMTP
jgi:hypothetical protein